MRTRPQIAKEPTTLLPLTAIARRAGRAVPTITRKLEARGIMPDGVVELGARTPIPVFESGRLPDILKAVAS